MPPRKGPPIAPSLKETGETHPALREIRMGRGYGVTLVPVVTFARMSITGRTLHIISPEQRAICGLSSDSRPVQLFVDYDPKSVVISGSPVCVRCQDTLGAVPMPRLATEGDE